MISNKLKLDNGFSKEDLSQLETVKLIPPSEITRENCHNHLENAIHVLKRCRSAKGASVKYGNGDYAAALDRVMNVIRAYINLLKFKSGIIRGGSLKKFSKLRPDGRYGLLEIHMPKLMNDNHITATRNGEIVYDKDCDDDAVELLTKRFNNGKCYSNQSKKIFEELTQLGKVPRTRNTVKFDKICICDDYHNGVPYMVAEDDESEKELEEDSEGELDEDQDTSSNALVTRLEQIRDAVKQGAQVDSDILKEIKVICKELHNRDVITSDEKDEIIKGYSDIKNNNNYHENDSDEELYPEHDRELINSFNFTKALLERGLYGMVNGESFKQDCGAMLERGLIDKDKVRKLLKMCEGDDEDLESNYNHQKHQLYNGERDYIDMNKFKDDLGKMYDRGHIPLDEAKEITSICRFRW